MEKVLPMYKKLLICEARSAEVDIYMAGSWNEDPPSEYDEIENYMVGIVPVEASGSEVFYHMCRTQIIEGLVALNTIPRESLDETTQQLLHKASISVRDALLALPKRESL